MGDSTDMIITPFAGGGKADVSVSVARPGEGRKVARLVIPSLSNLKPTVFGRRKKVSPGAAAVKAAALAIRFPPNKPKTGENGRPGWFGSRLFTSFAADHEHSAGEDGRPWAAVKPVSPPAD